ncbi:MAG: permease [Clostridia bacterium]|nr:permease [Clostridia bacterium]
MAFSLAGAAVLSVTVFIIAAVGYALGRITIKGVSLGTAGVFIVALLFGAFFPNYVSDALKVKIGEEAVTYGSQALKIVENLGLVFFVTAVGFIAGPNFFKNFKKNYKSYVLLGVIIILVGGLSCLGCYYVGRGFEGDNAEFVAMLVGLLSGSLTSTPAFSAAKDTVQPVYENAVSVGHGIAYLFGVIGVVLFVQLIPKLTKADMEEERRKITIVDTGAKKKYEGKLVSMDKFGFMPFAVAVVLGILVGSVKFFNFFSLTTTGGTLIVALILGHFGRIGKLNITPDKKTLEVFRELGLMLFLVGAGVAGGISFVKYFKAVYFVYGIVMTILPMIVGFLFAKYVLKLSLLNNLGSITGGMTSTPALGTLINVSGTDDVASAYAATYPVALIAVVLVSQLIITVFS